MHSGDLFLDGSLHETTPEARLCKFLASSPLGDDAKNLQSRAEVSFEQKAREKGLYPLVGVDEAGRGPLAGPVVAAACILPSHFPQYDELKDSKQLSAKERKRFFSLLTSHPDVRYSVQFVSEKMIDTVNILQATLLAMKRAIMALKKEAPLLVLVDGNTLPSIPYPAHAIIHGDKLCPSISAASILAKVARDAFVSEYDKKWPHFRFSEHKGYGTPYHLEMIERYGILPVHRTSFDPIKSLLNL